MIVEDMRGSVGAIVLLGALLRAPGLFTGLWLDEIHALSSATDVRSAIEVFTGIHHDSNHWLVSLWMHLVGPAAPFWVYRLPSFLAGIAAVLFAGWLAALEGSKPGLAMLLTATSFPLIFYSSEARGYSLAALASLCLLLCLVRWFETRRRSFLAGSALSACLGLLSHLSFVMVLIAVAVYSLVLAGRGAISLRNALSPPAVPVLLLAGLVAINAGQFVIGGGTSAPPGTVLVETASLALGGPVEGPFVGIVAGLACALLAFEMVRRVGAYWSHRNSTEVRSHLWVFFVAAMLLPIWLVLTLDPPFLYPRYFLVLLVFVPLLAASFAHSLARPWSALLVFAWLSVNGCAIWGFTGDGRGGYEEALRFLMASSDRVEVEIGSDHDFRNRTILAFYRGRMGSEGARLRYVISGPAEFWIGSYKGSRCEGCQLLREYPSTSLSGARWRLYRRR